jgi:glycosyltransferase involved in cell wall biosynthesis
VRLLLFNLATDEDDPVLGFTSAWIRALAARCVSVHVITMRAGRLALPANVEVRSVGKERGHSIPRRIAAFYRLLLRVLREQRIDACFSHMMPVFSVMAAPLLRARGIPLVTWYAHPSLTRTLKLAHRFSDRMVASLPTAYPYRADKLIVIGQGIDTDLFSPGGPEADPRLLLSVGRLSPVKDHPTLIEAAARLHAEGESFRLAVVGGPAGAGDESYAAELRARAEARGLGGLVEWVGPRPPAALPEWYRRCAAHVNLTRTGSGDKSALEAMSCGRPSVLANEGFRDVLGRHAGALWFPQGDAAALAARLRALLRRTPADRARIGRDLRARVVADHGLPGLAARLLQVLGDERRRQAERETR